jgi:hypothetical protein
MSKQKNITTFKLTAEEDSNIFRHANDMANKYDQSCASVIRNAIRQGLRQMREADNEQD